MSMAKTKEDIEKDIQEKYIQLQMLKQQATSLLEERNQLEEQVRELTLTTDAVKQIGAVKQGSEIWSSLGGGAFVRSDIKDTEHVLINVGAGVILKKDRVDALEIIEGRLQEVTQFYGMLLEEIKKYTAGISFVEESLNDLLKSYS